MANSRIGAYSTGPPLRTGAALLCGLRKLAAADISCALHKTGLAESAEDGCVLRWATPARLGQQKEDSYGEESKEGQEGKKSTSQEVIETAPPKAGPDYLSCTSCFALENAMAKMMTKSELIEKIVAEQDGI